MFSFSNAAVLSFFLLAAKSANGDKALSLRGHKEEESSKQAVVRMMVDQGYTFGGPFSLDDPMELDEEEEKDLIAIGKALETMTPDEMDDLEENQGGTIAVPNEEGGGHRELQVNFRSYVWVITQPDGRCMTANGNVQMQPCVHQGTGDNKQKWKFVSKRGQTSRFDGFIYNRFWDQCLDNNFNTGNAYVHTCHFGRNQLWRAYSEGELKSFQDSKCLDKDADGSNVGMWPCHGRSNQEFLWG